MGVISGFFTYLGVPAFISLNLPFRDERAAIRKQYLENLLDEDGR